VSSANPVIVRNEESGVYSRELFARLWQRRTWIGASTLFFAIAFTAIAFLMTPIYRASTLLVPAGIERGRLGSLNSTLGQLGGLASLAGLNLGSGDIETEEALAVLRSREFTQRFISEKNLMPELYSSKWDFDKKAWKVPEKKQPTPADAYKYVDKGIRHINRDVKTGLVTVQIDWKNRDEAASWGNAMVERINDEMRDRAIIQADAYIGFLTQELAKTTDIGIRDAINHLIESQIKQRMVASVSKEYAFRVIDRALAPDAKDRERPIKSLYALMGLALGLAVGCFAALVFPLLAESRA
jgi:LPS O-antigen subunit length determinant protein (WzzB/FepE family)